MRHHCLDKPNTGTPPAVLVTNSRKLAEDTLSEHSTEDSSTSGTKVSWEDYGEVISVIR